ncbi:MAG: hypothetical protein JST81_10275 [Bacteroidetes bacterium]|nr:hypothetical protein [Bacteroidota bacterium]
MKKILLYISLALLLPAVIHAQQVADSSKSNADFTFLKFIPGSYVFMDVDVLDNIYLLTSGYQLKKLNNNADSVAVFNDVKKYGNPSHIDVSNPLKILVYYKNYSTVVVLDRLLTKRNTINLRKQNIFSVQAIATSYDNNIWLYDEQDNKLKKIDDEGKVLTESTDLRLLTDSTPSPTRIIDSDNLVYLYDEKKGFYIFDYYGALKNNLPFFNWQNIAIARKKMYGFTGNQLISYELGSFTQKEYKLPHFIKDYLSIKAINGKVYLLKTEGVEIYSVK